ncbi:MAG: trypsin-like peptidase domain-containing protein [Candidatus Babeliales bacterium]|jgi:S1-C subfamily serine protease
MLRIKNIIHTSLLWVALLLTSSYASLAPQSSQPQSWDNIFEHTKNSVVQIFALGTHFNWEVPFQAGDRFEHRGGGVIVSPQGDIYTNFHVIDEADVIYIQHPLLEEKFAVDFLGASPSCDLAHLRIKSEDFQKLTTMLSIKQLEFLTLGDSDRMKQGNEIMLIGYPLGDEEIKLSLGTISGQTQSAVGGECFTIDASTYPGNSGGPVLNNNGEVIGFAVAVAENNGRAVENIGHVIPVNRLKTIAQELKDGIILRSSYWGLHFAPTTAETLMYVGSKDGSGIYVSDVQPGSLAEKAGIKTGDIIIKVNGFKVNRFGNITVPWTDYRISFTDLLARIRNGDRVEFTVRRKEKIFNCSVEKCTPTETSVRSYHLPFEEKPPYDVFGGMVFMEMTKNHIAQFLSSMYGLFTLIPSSEDKTQTHWAEQLKFAVSDAASRPHVIITHVFPETELGKSSMFGPFDCIIEKVNTIKVRTLEELRNAICKGASTGYILIETRYGTKVVLPLAKILAQEKELADKYGYQLSSLIEQINAPRTANHPQKALRP